MRIAVVAVTKQGVTLAERVAGLLAAEGLHQPVLYLPGKFSLLRIEGERHPYRKPLRDVFAELFDDFEGIVCIMALGIVVRLAAPHLRDKTADPAVVAIDELGNNVISVLSGHWGGANALTAEIAAGINANPVITTATDVHGLPAIEMLARDNGWGLEPFDLVKKVNAAIVNGSKVVIYSEAPFSLELEQLEVRDFAQYAPGRREEGRVVLVTNRTARSFPPGTLFLRPHNLCVGVGCRRGAEIGEVADAVTSALEECGRALGSVCCLVSVDIKKDEEGIRQAALELGLATRFFAVEELAGVMEERAGELGFSEFVDDKIGVGGVCEPAAILGAGKCSRLIMPKTKYGKVTVAIAEGDWQ